MSALRHFIWARFVGKLGDSFLLFAVPLLVFKTTGSASQSGLAVFIEWAPRVCFFPFAGIFADRFSGKSLYLLGDTLRITLVLGAYFGITYFPQHTFAFLTLMSAILAVISAQLFVALETAVARHAKDEDLAKIQSIVQGSRQLSDVGGPLLAGTVALFLPVQNLLWVASLVFFVGWLSVLFSAEKLEAIQSSYRPIEWKKAAAVVFQNPLLLRLVALTWLVNLLGGLGLATLAPLLSLYHQPDSMMGLVGTWVGVLGVVSSFTVPYFLRHARVEGIGKFAFSGIVLGAIVCSVAPSFTGYVLGYGLMQGLVGMYSIFASTVRARLIPKAEMGRALGLIVLIGQASVPLAGLLISLTASSLPVQGLYRVVAALCLVFGIYAFSYLERSARPCSYARVA